MEMMVTIAMISIILIPLTRLQINVFAYNRFFQNTIAMQEEARKNLQKMSSEIRSSNVAANGAYPIGEAGENSLIFYRDADHDGVAERIRYFLDGEELKRGVIIPSGNPLAYNLSSEVITVTAHEVKNDSVPVFEYFDTGYDGTKPVLTQPVDPTDVRLIKVELFLGKGNENQAQTKLTTQISLRNLKDNL